MTSGDDNTARFRTKVAFMKTWKPANPPSNRDRLELYALHKQVISGDAPSTIPSAVTNVAPEKAKYQAWKSKQGMPVQQAMQQYIQEADRQVRVYGTTPALPLDNAANHGQTQLVQADQPSKDFEKKSANPQTPLNTPNANEDSGGENNGSNSNNNGNRNPSSAAGQPGNAAASSAAATPTSRGLAAIPLLCAAAGESRPGYIRRLSQTPSVDHGWWKRQEVLCSSPGSIAAIPESVLLFIARTVEYVSLAGQEENFKRQRRQQQERSLLQRQQQLNQGALVRSAITDPPTVPTTEKSSGPPILIRILMIFPSAIIQAFLWPVHNCLLSLWMAIILVTTLISGAWRSLQTLIWGARRTGIALRVVWQTEVQGTAQAIHSLCQPYQAITCRLVGLVLLPISTIVGILQGILGDSSVTLSSMGYTMTMMTTWWYWTICLPWLASGLLGIAFASGTCFALIEFAGV